ncbi:hypothetical protein EAS54_16315 [Bradyrhizobium guangzhouense]|nr:hypothetical protein EAS54_16315 [Bradyrhizobium guangzhouense]
MLFASVLLLKPGERSFFNRLIRPYLAAALVLCAWIVIQILPLPFVAHSIWKSASEALDTQLRGSISVDLSSSLGALIVVLSALGTFVAATAISVEPRRAKWIANAVMWTASAFATAILIEHAIGRILPDLRGLAPHSAVLVSLIGIPLGLARAIEALGQGRTGEGVRSAIHNALVLVGIVLMLSAALVNAAREIAIPMGVGAILIALIWLTRRSRISALASIVAVMALAAIAAASAISLRDKAELPLAISFSKAPGNVMDMSVNVLADVPRQGIGAGAISALLPTYADPAEANAPEMASAAGAALAEMGAPFFWCACAIILLASMAFYLGAVRRGRDWSFAASGAAVIPGIMLAAFILPDRLTVGGTILLAASTGMAAAQRISRLRTNAE